MSEKQASEQPPAAAAADAAAAATAPNASKQGDKHDQYADPPKSCIAAHPDAIAVAVGAELRVLDRRSGQLHVLLAASRANAACVRGVAFDPTGRWLAAGGDDKCFRVWSCESWECLKTLKAPKKISAVAFSKGGSVVLAADKFGDVLVARTAADPGDAAGAGVEILLGHYCSLLTSLSLSSAGRFIATTDRDMKLRVSAMPDDPMAGAHSIQSYCFGHTSFVTCAAFALADDKEVLLSGGGDGTLRMWDHRTGAMLCTLPLGVAEAPADGDATPSAVLAVAVAPGGQHAVVVVDGRDELCVVSLDVGGGAMQIAGWRVLPGLHLPSDVCCDAAGRVWAAGGPPTLGSSSAFLVCGSIGGGGELMVAEAKAFTLAEREALEARDGNEAEVSVQVGAARRSHLASYLRKREFTAEEAAERKRKRLEEKA